MKLHRCQQQNHLMSAEQGLSVLPNVILRSYSSCMHQVCAQIDRLPQGTVGQHSMCTERARHTPHGGLCRKIALNPRRRSARDKVSWHRVHRGI